MGRGGWGVQVPSCGFFPVALGWSVGWKGGHKSEDISQWLAGCGMTRAEVIVPAAIVLFRTIWNCVVVG